MCIIKGAEAVLPPDKIASAVYDVRFLSGDSDIEEAFGRFISSESITVVKKTKSGEKETDIKDKIVVEGTETNREKNEITLKLTLPAGGADNINPFLFTGAFAAFHKKELGISVFRSEILTITGEPFA